MKNGKPENAMQIISQGRNLASDSPLLLFLEGSSMMLLLNDSLLPVSLLPQRRKGFGRTIE